MKILGRVLEATAAHARASRPLECCGILLAEGAGALVATRALPARNAAEHPLDRYVLGHEAHLDAVQLEADGAARIVGYYHSHPGGECRPSPHDLDRAAGDLPVLIVAVNDGAVDYAAWRLQGAAATQEPLEVWGEGT